MLVGGGGGGGGSLRPLQEREFCALRDIVYEAAGITLSDSKRQLVASRLARRLRHHSLETYGAYVALLQSPAERDAELQELLNCITTNKTNFFRESHHFDYLRRHLFPQARASRTMRIWSAGCSTGEEPYTLAMCAIEHFGDAAAERVEILASDINTSVIERARQAIYAEGSLGDLGHDRLRRFFNRGRGQAQGFAQVRPEVSRLVRFAKVNLNGPTWPDGDIHIIFCRNVIIYFSREDRDRLIGRFADRLPAGGHLFLGHSEGLHGAQDRFESLGGTIFRRPSSAPLPTQTETTPPSLPSLSSPLRPKRSASPPKDSPKHPIRGGEYRACADGSVLTTVLGSCVAACLYDPLARVGGMNHFLLPDGDDHSARYGIHAMELLINEIMRLGGDRYRLQAKIFGANKVLQSGELSDQVSEKNASFVREFLHTEGIPIKGERLLGHRALYIHMFTDTGRVLCREVEHTSVTAAEAQLRQSLRQQHSPDDVTLFQVDPSGRRSSHAPFSR